MPRVVFEDAKQTMEWINRFVTKKSHTALVTQAGELVLEPMRSTPPIRYGYLDNNRPEQDVKSVVAFLQEAGITVLRCRLYEFATDKPVGLVIRGYNES